MNTLNWERLRILKCALEAGSISAAAKILGTSQPTVSRQLSALESDLGAKVFQTVPEGIIATEIGKQFLPLLSDMERAASKLPDLYSPNAQSNTVRITCGSWMGAYLSKNIGLVSRDQQNLTIEILSTKTFLDIPRREADISICNKRPTTGRLKSKRIGRISYAVYCTPALAKRTQRTAKQLRLGEFDWATLTPEFDNFSSSKWITKTIKKPPLLRCSSILNLLDAVNSGSVVALIPVLSVEPKSKLIKLCEPLQFDDDYGWLVFSEDARKQPLTNLVIENLLDLFNRDKKLIAG